jgi:phage portal protein BeeE
VGKKGRNRTAVVAQTFADSPSYSISDPALAEFLGLAGVWGAAITEQQALSLTAVHRAQSLISGTIAGLPLKVYEGMGADRHQIPHFLTTNPAGPYDISGFNWAEMIVLPILNHTEAY